MSTYPELDDLLDRFQNGQLLEARVSYRSNFTIIFLFLVSIAGLYLLNYLYLINYESLKALPVFRSISPRWLAVVPIGLLLELTRRYHDDLYVFGTEKVTHYNGRLSLSYNVPTVRYSDIRALAVYQDVFGRIFNYGDIEIDTAAADRAEIKMQGVVDPKSLAHIIEGLKEYNYYLESISETERQSEQLAAASN